MKLSRVIYVEKDKNFKKNGCIHVSSADYPDIKVDIYTFSESFYDISCQMAIHGAAVKVEKKVRERNGEFPFKICFVEKE